MSVTSTDYEIVGLTVSPRDRACHLTIFASIIYKRIEKTYGRVWTNAFPRCCAPFSRLRIGATVMSKAMASSYTSQNIGLSCGFRVPHREVLKQESPNQCEVGLLSKLLQTISLPAMSLFNKEFGKASLINIL